MLVQKGIYLTLYRTQNTLTLQRRQEKTGKAHKDVNYWHYFIKTVQIDGTIFDVLANIRRKSKDSYVYLIELYENKNIEAASPSSDPKSGASTRVPTANMDSIRNSEPNVKRRGTELRLPAVSQ